MCVSLFLFFPLSCANHTFHWVACGQLIHLAWSTFSEVVIKRFAVKEIMWLLLRVSTLNSHRVKITRGQRRLTETIYTHAHSQGERKDTQNKWWSSFFVSVKLCLLCSFCRSSTRRLIANVRRIYFSLLPIHSPCSWRVPLLCVIHCVSLSSLYQFSPMQLLPWRSWTASMQLPSQRCTFLRLNLQKPSPRTLHSSLVQLHSQFWILFLSLSLSFCFSCNGMTV